MSRRASSGSDSHKNLLDLIYGAVCEPYRWPEVLDGISKHLDAVGGMIACLPNQGPPISITAGLSVELLEVYHQHYAWNPWSSAMSRAPLERVVAVNSLTLPGEVIKSDFYADVLAPQGIVNSLQFAQGSMSRGGLGGFGFMLSAGAADRIDERARKLQRLAPHLGRALDATLRLGTLADGTRQLATVLQLMPNPALLLDGKGRITLANSAAEALLRTNDGLAMNNDGGFQLAASLPSETAALSGALARALAIASGDLSELGGPLRLTRKSGAAPLVVFSIPLPPPAFAFWELLEPARILVLIIDPSVQSLANAAVVQAAFGLTSAEARVAMLIGSGLGGPETAAMLGISPGTVKTHLKRCFDKLGVHSQVGLARVLGALPLNLSKGQNLN